MKHFKNKLFSAKHFALTFFAQVKVFALTPSSIKVLVPKIVAAIIGARVRSAALVQAAALRASVPAQPRKLVVAYEATRPSVTGRPTALPVSKLPPTTTTV